jgi:hypothetical protein
MPTLETWILWPRPSPKSHRLKGGSTRDPLHQMPEYEGVSLDGYPNVRNVLLRPVLYENKYLRPVLWHALLSTIA